jgi:uncharacterized protein (TIGR02145 family)
MKKRLLTTLAVLCLAVFAFAQAPQKMNYQALVKDANNNAVAMQAVGAQVTLLQGGEAVYTETHTATTDTNAILALEIGGGTVVSGTFADIDWSLGNYSLKVEIDPEGGNNYTLTSEQALLAVPYAFFADKNATAFSGNYNDLEGTPTIPTAPTVISAFENDANYIKKESQQLSVEGTTISINDGVGEVVNSVEMPAETITKPEGTATGDMLVWDAEANDWKALPADAEEGVKVLTIGENGVPAWVKEQEEPVTPPAELGTVIIKDKIVVGQDALFTCEVTADGGAEVTERGICFSASNAEPGMEDQVVKAGAGVGEFDVEVNGLTAETKYYVRAYATNEVGTAFSDVVEILTESGEIIEPDEMTVEAGEVSSVTRTNATVSATLKNGKDVTERGFLYSLYKNMTLNSHATYALIGTKVVEGTEDGEFSTTFDGLIQGAIYYVRAFVKAGEDVIYSPDMKVVMEDPEGLVDCGKVTDADGNEYRTVKLGEQCWMRENLRTTKYNDGTDISKFTPVASTIKVSETVAEYTLPVITTTKDTLVGDMAGYYYGYGLRKDPKANMICPTGWHIPTAAEFDVLFAYLNTTYNEGALSVKKYVASGNVNICSNTALYYPMILPYYFNTNGFNKVTENTNATGFAWFYFGELDGNDRESHYRTTQAYYEGMWTSTEYGSYMNVFVQHNGTYLQYANQGQNVGYSRTIRCLKD